MTSFGPNLEVIGEVEARERADEFRLALQDPDRLADALAGLTKPAATAGGGSSPLPVVSEVREARQEDLLRSSGLDKQARIWRQDSQHRLAPGRPFRGLGGVH